MFDDVNESSRNAAATSMGKTANSSRFARGFCSIGNNSADNPTSRFKDG
jgi:hypothetical protein